MVHGGGAIASSCSLKEFHHICETTWSHDHCVVSGVSKVRQEMDW